MKKFPEIILFSSHDHALMATVASMIIEILPGGVIDKMLPYDEYLGDSDVLKLQERFLH